MFVEYNTYGTNSSLEFSRKITSNPNLIGQSSVEWKKYYYITDNLGSVRLVLEKSANESGFTLTKSYKYKPFGEIQHNFSIGPIKDNFDVTADRKMWIAKESDKESDLGDLGYRKYDNELGRFLSVDPLWEKYASLTPYQYSFNNPIAAKDVNGKDVIVLIDREGAKGFGHMGMLIGNENAGWKLYSKNGADGFWNVFVNKSGNSFEPDDGLDFKTINDFKQDKHANQLRYDLGYLIKSSPEQDTKMRDAASIAVKTKFNIMSANCADAVESGLSAGGLNTGYELIQNTNFSNIEDPVSLLMGTFVGTTGTSSQPCKRYTPLAPNDRYNNIKNNNSGSSIKLRENE